MKLQNVAALLVTLLAPVVSLAQTEGVISGTLLTGAPVSQNAFYGLCTSYCDDAGYKLAAQFTLSDSSYVATVEVVLWSSSIFDISLQNSLISPTVVFSGSVTTAADVNTEAIKVNAILPAGTYYIVVSEDPASPTPIPGWFLSNGAFISNAGTVANGLWTFAPRPDATWIFASSKGCGDDNGSNPCPTPAFGVNACPVDASDVFLYPGGGMLALLTPSFGLSLDAAASACGFNGFDWVQKITQWPSPSGLFLASDTSTPVTLPPPPAINDPPSGGYSYPASQQPPFLGASPFYYNPASAQSACAEIPPIGPCLPITFGSNALYFFDGPKNPCLPGGVYAFGGRLGSLGKCQGIFTLTPPFMSFTTQLVGICNAAPSSACISAGQPSAPLFQWTWSSDFNGSTGGVFDVESASSYPPDPGSGTGGVTITSINGVSLPPVVPASQVATTASGLAYSRVSQTFNGTLTVTNISSGAINGPLQILFTGLTADVTLKNATSALSGTPYLTIPAVASLAPGQSATVNIQFENPSNAAINFTPIIYSGSIN